MEKTFFIVLCYQFGIDQPAIILDKVVPVEDDDSSVKPDQSSIVQILVHSWHAVLNGLYTPESRHRVLEVDVLNTH